MAPTIIALPAVGWRSVKFDPTVPRDSERMEGRRTEGQRFGTPWWQALYTSTALTLDDFGLAEAFMMQAGDNGEVFRAYDAGRARPILHDNANHDPLSGTRAGGGAFDGTATLGGITSSREVFVTHLPAYFQFRAGDYVEFAMSESLISLHRIIEDAQAGPGGTVTLKFRYGLDTENFTPAATVNFEKPSCLMQIDPGSYNASKELIGRSFSFAAQEVFFQ